MMISEFRYREIVREVAQKRGLGYVIQSYELDCFRFQETVNGVLDSQLYHLSKEMDEMVFRAGASYCAGLFIGGAHYRRHAKGVERYYD